MTDLETVLHDLLLECGVDGVTLWQIRALAVALKSSNAPLVVGEPARIVEDRFFYDMRGEDTVLAEAWAENEERDAATARLSDAVAGTAFSASITAFVSGLVRWRMERVKSMLRSVSHQGHAWERHVSAGMLEPEDGANIICSSCAYTLPQAIDHAEPRCLGPLGQNSPRTPPPAAPDVVPHASTHSE